MKAVDLIKKNGIVRTLCTLRLRIINCCWICYVLLKGKMECWA